MIVGYRRVSSIDQSLERQDLGSDCEKIFEEKVSGRNIERPELQRMLEFIREGDEVRVWSIDRLGRSLTDLASLVEHITKKGASIRFISERMEFASGENDPFKTLQFQLLAAFAQFERAIAERRRLEGMAAARASGRYKKAGRKRQEFSVDEAMRLYREGKSIRQIAKELNAGKTTVANDIKKRLAEEDKAREQ